MKSLHCSSTASFNKTHHHYANWEWKYLCKAEELSRVKHGDEWRFNYIWLPLPASENQLNIYNCIPQM